LERTSTELKQNSLLKLTGYFVLTEEKTGLSEKQSGFLNILD